MFVVQEQKASMAVHVLEGELSPQAVRARWKPARLGCRSRSHRTLVLQARPQERPQAGG